MRAAALVQIVLLGLCVVVGLVGTVAVAIDWLQGLDTWFWDESTCTIESSQAVERPQYGDFDFQVSYRFQYKGDPYLGEAYRHRYHGSETASEAETLASRYAVGDNVQCWVDPRESPGESASYLRRANLWEGLWILVPLLFVAVGCGALWLIHGRSSHTERQETAGRLPVSSNAHSGIRIGAVILLPGICFLFGAGFLIPFFVRPALQVMEARSWTELTCEIVSSRVRSHAGEDGSTYSIDALYRYEIEGREYRANRYQFMGGSSSGYDHRARIVEALPAGASTICYVNPNDPFDAVIERGFTGDYLFGLVPLFFTLIGIGGLAFAIKVLRSAKEDAALPSWPTTQGEVSATGARVAGTGVIGAFGWRPESTYQTDQAAAGPIVLEPAIGPIGKLGCSILITLFWNGFISIFVWQVVQSWRAGSPEWFVIIILTPFVLVGLLLLISIPHSILALLNPRPRVQLTPGTLRVGEAAQIEWEFRGFSGRIRRLEIRLEATETTIREDDSSGSIEARPLETATITVLERGREEALEYGGESFTVPFDTLPSSEGDVSIRWQLKLHGDIAYWPDVNEAFEVRLLPARTS